MNFANDDDELLKQIMNKGNEGYDDINVDDELNALEAEVNGPKSNDKKKKGDNDDLSLSDLSDDDEKSNEDKKANEELKQLENEDLDDDDEDIDNKIQQKPKIETLKKAIDQNPTQQRINTENLNKEIQNKKQITNQQTKQQSLKISDDIYPEKPEGKYHSVQKMTSLGVLKEEKELCDKIIQYKKKFNLDYDTWEIKKEDIDQRSQQITTTIENGVWDFDMYKKKIKEQSDWESKLLFFLTKDPILSPNQKAELKKRVEKRIQIIKQELAQQIEENEDEEEKTDVKKEEKPKIETKKEEKKEEKKNEQLQKKNTHVVKVPKDKEKEECDKLTEIVTERLKEYRDALEYFKKNDLTKQQAPCINSAKEICIELKKIKDGNWKDVDEFELPDPVVPEFIYGYSNDERKKKFTKIITGIFNQKKEISEEMQKKIDAFKKLSKAKFQKIQNAAKNDLDIMKTKKEKYEKILSLLKLNVQDKWVPAPLFVEEQEEIKIEKINKDIPENVVKVIIGKTNYVKDGLILVIKLLDTKADEFKFEQKSPGNISKSFDWKLDKYDFKGFYQKTVSIELYSKKIMKNELKGYANIQPKGLKDHIEYKNNFNLELESEKEGKKIEVIFKVRNACHTPEYETTTKSIFSITKIYPSFKNNNTNVQPIKLDAINTPKVTSNDLKIEETKKPQIKQIEQKPKPNNVVAKPSQATQTDQNPVSKGQPIDKSKFSEEELNDPDCVNALNTLQVLEFKHKKYEDIRSKIDGRTPRELMQKIVKIKCKINVLNQSLGDTIGPEDYLNLLKNTFAHDKLLAEYFAQQNDAEKGKLVRERLPLLLKETQELMAQMGAK